MLLVGAEELAAKKSAELEHAKKVAERVAREEALKAAKDRRRKQIREMNTVGARLQQNITDAREAKRLCF